LPDRQAEDLNVISKVGQVVVWAAACWQAGTPVPTDPVDAAGDARAIQGSWSQVGFTVLGQAEPLADEIRQTVLEVSVTKWTFREPNQLGIEATYRIDATKSPREIDVVHTGGLATLRFLGIYELSGDELKVCFNNGLPQSARPESFDSKAAGTTGMTFKRKKP
jgi:uncharacterized protein (TIGR03067 family)